MFSLRQMSLNAQLNCSFLDLIKHFSNLLISYFKGFSRLYIRSPIFGIFRTGKIHCRNNTNDKMVDFLDVSVSLTIFIRVYIFVF